MDIDRRLSKDRKRARLSFEEQSFDVDVSGMQALIRLLAATRSAMLPEEPLEYVPPKSVHAVAEPSWTVEPELLNGDILVHFREPGFGWLHFCLSKSTAERLGTHLLALAEQANTPEGKPN